MEIIKLNLIPTGVNPTCHCSQYDEGRVIRIELFDGLTPYTLQSGDTVTLNVRKPDNTIVTASVTATQGNNYVDIVTTEQICAVVGYNLCDLTITNGSVVIGTLNFIMAIERDVLADGIASQSVIKDLDALVAEAVEADLGDSYYTKAQVDTALNSKADKSTVDEQLSNLNLSCINGLKVRGNKIPFAVKEYYPNSYWANSNGKVVKGGNSKYDAYKLEITDTTGVIYFKNSPYTFISDENNNVLAGVNNTYASSYDLSNLSGVKYIYFTNHKGIATAPYVSENLINLEQQNEIETSKYSNHCKISQDITPTSNRIYIAGGYANSVMQNMIVSLNFDISAFNNFELGFMDLSSTKKVKFAVTSTTLTYTLPNGTSVSDNHGLTFADNIQMVVKVDDTDKVKISLTSGGVTFNKTWVFRNEGVWRPYAQFTNTTTTAYLSWAFNTLNKDIWAFGDSYFAYDATRWVYYLSQDGYQNNCLIDGFGGRNSNQAFTALTDLLKIGIPKYIFWCLGMNDGSDSSTDPSSTWLTNIHKVITICNQFNITLILATVPTVPTVNNEKKNEFVRTSGYQYVDFAKAVGAQANGTWFNGMLSNDNVHPSQQGGIALYNRVLCDFPQIVVR